MKHQKLKFLEHEAYKQYCNAVKEADRIIGNLRYAKTQDRIDRINERHAGLLEEAESIKIRWRSAVWNLYIALEQERLTGFEKGTSSE